MYIVPSIGYMRVLAAQSVAEGTTCTPSRISSRYVVQVKMGPVRDRGLVVSLEYELSCSVGVQLV